MPTYASERCEACGEQTQHRVEIEMVEETKGKAHSREPYRTAVCRQCGTERTRRMSTV